MGYLPCSFHGHSSENHLHWTRAWGLGAGGWHRAHGWTLGEVHVWNNGCSQDFPGGLAKASQVERCDILSPMPIAFQISRPRSLRSCARWWLRRSWDSRELGVDEPSPERALHCEMGSYFGRRWEGWQGDLLPEPFGPLCARWIGWWRETGMGGRCKACWNSHQELWLWWEDKRIRHPWREDQRCRCGGANEAAGAWAWADFELQVYGHAAGLHVHRQARPCASSSGVGVFNEESKAGRLGTAEETGEVSGEVPLHEKDVLPAEGRWNSSDSLVRQWLGWRQDVKEEYYRKCGEAGRPYFDG